MMLFFQRGADHSWLRQLQPDPETESLAAKILKAFKILTSNASRRVAGISEVALHPVLTVSRKRA